MRDRPFLNFLRSTEVIMTVIVVAKEPSSDRSYREVENRPILLNIPEPSKIIKTILQTNTHIIIDRIVDPIAPQI